MKKTFILVIALLWGGALFAFTGPEYSPEEGIIFSDDPASQLKISLWDVSGGDERFVVSGYSGEDGRVVIPWEKIVPGNTLMVRVRSSLKLEREFLISPPVPVEVTLNRTGWLNGGRSVKETYAVKGAFGGSLFGAPSHIYSPSLGSFCIMLCGASYLKEGKENTEKEAEFLKELGFTDIEKENYYGVRQTERSDKAGLYIARRKIFDGSKETELLLCVVRGTVAGEWFSNFDVGEGDEHRGFTAAAENAFGYIQSYMVRHAVPRTAKVLVTGHSRGAAVASMLVPMLKESGFGEDSVYAYVYACPNYTKNLVPGEKGLFGFMYEGDLVPAIPMWGFGMRGEVIDSVSFSPEEKKQLKDTFSRIAGGIKTVAFTAEERDGVVAAITKLAPDQEAFYTTVYSKSKLIKADPMTTYDFCVKMGKIMVQREVKRVLRVPDDFNGIMWAFVTDGAASPKIIQSHSIEMYYALTQVYNARFAKAAN